MGWDLGNLVAKGMDLDRRKVGRSPGYVIPCDSESLDRDPARDFCLCLDGHNLAHIGCDPALVILFLCDSEFKGLSPGLISILCGSESSGRDPVLIILIPHDFESLGRDHGLVGRNTTHDFCLCLEA
ncbi:uncharacterized protein G2W53_009702 [Senna tora]|uniref:Uncharacterized protein n=1 Tax=Senna tora TaxID=362788 RepID=A0A834WYW2_9FABA|nr:uncharacterized protein G2W53_009702 [Senna tora]